YTANPSAASGLTASVAAAASAWGDAMGVALGRTDSGAGIDAARAIQNAVANALFDNAQSSSSPPGVKYAEGVAIGSLPTHTNFQGEGGGGGGSQEVIVTQAVANTKTPFPNPTGATILGIGGQTPDEGAGGTIDMTNFPGFTTIIYETLADQTGTGTTFT